MKINSPLFNAENYQLFRPVYPQGIFSEVFSVLGDTNFIAVDLGCGTGISSQAFLSAQSRMGQSRVQSSVQSSVQLYALDSDLQMLEASKIALNHFQIKFLHQTAENTTLPDRSADLVFSGSAYHWFDAQKTFEEVSRILKPGGLFFAFEYQFPRAVSCNRLNDWARRQFNSRFKAPIQVPRGKFRELFKHYFESQQFQEIKLPKIEMIQNLSTNEYCGHLFSQSRFLHYENKLNSFDQMELREEVFKTTACFFEENSNQGRLFFDYKFDRLLFRKDSI